MSSSAELHLSYKVGNAPIQTYPYPHFFLENAFPSDFYAEMQAKLPDPEAMRPIAEVRPVRGYKERFVMGFEDAALATLPEDKREFWLGLRQWLVGGRFANLVLHKFEEFLDDRFNRDPKVDFYDEALLVQDTTNYALGPHCDAQRKVITMLFYLPSDESQRHLGTSMYLPKEADFTCDGTKHHARAGFERLWTMPFLPNSLFAFFKTDTSFHGVEPVTEPDCRRWLLLYDIYHRREK